MGEAVIGVDIEATNRCNAVCHFCPRDKTPHAGLMTQEVFDETLRRAVELNAFTEAELGLSVYTTICGLGEPLLNPRTPGFIAAARAAGLPCRMSSNGSLLDDARAQAVLDAGVQSVMINVGTVDDEYEAVYGLPFERTRDRILAFHERSAAYDCDVYIVLVDFKQSPDHVAEMEQFWRGHGIRRFMTYEIMNRGGALFVEHMQYDAMPERSEARRILASMDVAPLCLAPFVFAFVGYDGHYYLCCSDWTKESSMGTVFDSSFVATADARLAALRTREPVCRTCNHDPLNRLTDVLGARNRGEATDDDVAALVAQMADTTRANASLVDGFVTAGRAEGPAAPRRLIPVRGLG